MTATDEPDCEPTAIDRRFGVRSENEADAPELTTRHVNLVRGPAETDDGPRTDYHQRV